MTTNESIIVQWCGTGLTHGSQQTLVAIWSCYLSNIVLHVLVHQTTWRSCSLQRPACTIVRLVCSWRCGKAKTEWNININSRAKVCQRYGQVKGHRHRGSWKQYFIRRNVVLSSETYKYLSHHWIFSFGGRHKWGWNNCKCSLGSSLNKKCNPDGNHRVRYYTLRWTLSNTDIRSSSIICIYWILINQHSTFMCTDQLSAHMPTAYPLLFI